MKITKKIHLLIGLQNASFVILLLVAVGLVAYLSTRYKTEFDWTQGARLSLSEPSRKLLATLDGPIKVTAYARENPQLRTVIRDLIDRYRRHKKDITLDFVNPDTRPDKVRELGIQVDGELVLEYQGRSEKVQDQDEENLTNALQRLARAEERKVLFLQGHGERNLLGQANHDLGQLGSQLGIKGIKLLEYNLAKTPEIPDNISLLIIAGPQTPFLPGEIQLLESYLDKGGNLLWLADGGTTDGLERIAAKLGLKALPGVVVDASTQLFGIEDPTFALVAEYPPHPITENLNALTVFPTTTALEAEPAGDYRPEPLLSTLPRSWSETGTLEGEIRFDADQGEHQGPLDIGYAITRALADGTAGKKPTDGGTEPETEEQEPSREQRIVVIGDGDFLSNAFLGNGGNLRLGFNLIQWLNHDDRFLDIPPKTALDQKLDFDTATLATLGILFVLVLPLSLFGTGFWIWRTRRRR